MHVEERRGWDTRPVPAEVTNSHKGFVPSGHALQEGSAAAPVANSATTSSSSTTTTSPRTPNRSSPPVTQPIPPKDPQSHPNTIARLMADPTLFTPDFIAPNNVVVLCHGLYGFSTATPIPLFPSLKLHYWHVVLEALRDRLGCKILVVGVKGTGSIEERAGQMHAYLKETLPVGTGVNFVAHSMGGLDCRFLISHIKPDTYKPLSLTMIGTPNRGSPFMDWCAANIGVGSSAMAKAAVKMAASSAKKLPPYSLNSPLLTRPQQHLAAMNSNEKMNLAANGDSSVFGIPGIFGNSGSSITNYLLGLLDSPAYGNLTTHYLNEVFNPMTPDDPNVKYTSTAGRISKMPVLHPLWFPKLILDAAAERGYAEEEGKSGKEYEGNDGLVSVSSAKWGEWLGVVENCHHWDLRGEGGLFPQGGKIGDWDEPKPDRNSPDGWDWGALTPKIKAGTVPTETLKRGVESIAKVTGETTASVKTSVGNNLAQAQAHEHTHVDKPPSSWDLAQVGQVVDWVADFLPGSEKDERNPDDQAKIGTRQLADAAKEKAKEQRFADSIHSATGNQGLHPTGDKGPREKGPDEKRKKQEKFDVGRFYGGLMIKLREDGF